MNKEQRIAIRRERRLRCRNIKGQRAALFDNDAMYVWSLPFDDEATAFKKEETGKS